MKQFTSKFASTGRSTVPASRTIVVFLVALATLVTVPSCDETSSVAPAAEMLVVQAYLYAGQSVSDIRIGSTVPLGSTDTIPPPVNDASVALIRSGERYSLVPTGDGMYGYNGSDLTVSAGDVFDIEIAWRGSSVTARTVVPPPPSAVSISLDTLWIPQSATQSYFRSDSARATVRWTASAGELSYVLAENIESTPEPIELGSEPIRQARGRFITPPTAATSYMIGILNLTHYGRHRVTVYRINREYADLYMSREQNSRDLNEPLTNVSRGLGIFTAFNGAAVELVVAKK